MTTTDTDALKECLWEAVAEVRDQHPRVFNDAPTDDVIAAVLPIVAAEVRKAKAEAWDEGHNTRRTVERGGWYLNPYRETLDGTSPNVSRIRRLIGSPTTGCGRGPCCLGDGHDGDCRL